MPLLIDAMQLLMKHSWNYNIVEQFWIDAIYQFNGYEKFRYHLLI